LSPARKLPARGEDIGGITRCHAAANVLRCVHRNRDVVAAPYPRGLKLRLEDLIHEYVFQAGRTVGDASVVKESDRKCWPDDR
jgi:hypothetical protein